MLAEKYQRNLLPSIRKSVFQCQHDAFLSSHHTKTRTLIKEAYTSTLWSNSSNDQTLINQGYVYTGVKKEVK